MTEYVLTMIFGITTIVILDFLWIGYIANNLYRNSLGNLLKDKFSLKVAFLFYFIYVSGMYLLVFDYGRNDVVESVIIKSIVYGVIAYSTYNLTNLATLKLWPPSLVIVDILWGAILTLITAIVIFLSFNFI